MCEIINNIKISLVTPLRLVHVLLIVMVSDYEHMSKSVTSMLVICESDVVS